MRAYPAADEPRAEMSRRAVLLAMGAAGAAATGCAPPLDDPPAELRIATGPPGGVYREIGRALAAVLDKRLPRTRVRALTTGASADGLRLLADRHTELAFAQLDTTMAGLAQGPPRVAETTAVARLYDDWLHLVVRADGAIHELADLHQRVVAVGASGWGTQFTATRLLRLMPEVRPRFVNLTQAEEAAAFEKGRIEAFFTLTGVPTPAVSALARKVPIRLVALPGFAAKLNEHYDEGYPAYRSATIPSTAYPGVPATETVTVANLLLARPELPPDLVAVVAATLFAERDRLVEGHPEARSINVRAGIATGPIRLHRGSVDHFRSHKR